MKLLFSATVYHYDYCTSCNTLKQRDIKQQYDTTWTDGRRQWQRRMTIICQHITVTVSKSSRLRTVIWFHAALLLDNTNQKQRQHSIV